MEIAEARAKIAQQFFLLFMEDYVPDNGHSDIFSYGWQSLPCKHCGVDHKVGLDVWIPHAGSTMLTLTFENDSGVVFAADLTDDQASLMRNDLVRDFTGMPRFQSYRDELPEGAFDPSFPLQRLAEGYYRVSTGEIEQRTTQGDLSAWDNAIVLSIMGTNAHMCRLASPYGNGYGPTTPYEDED